MLLARATLGAGTTGSLKGKVTDKTTGQPLVGVSVPIEGTQPGAATNAQGEYVVYHVPAGIYCVKFLMIGYRSQVVGNVRIVMALRTTLNAALEMQTLEVTEAIVVAAERPLIPRDVTAGAHAVAGSRIEELPVNSFREILALQPGVTADGHVRGGRTTELLFLAHCLPIQQAVLGGSGSNLPSGSIGERTVETGGLRRIRQRHVRRRQRRDQRRKQGASALVEGVRRPHRREGDESRQRIQGLRLRPLARKALTNLLSANYRMSDTRWWPDTVPVFGSPIEENVNVVSKLHAQLTPNLKFLGQALFPDSDWDWHDYEYRWRFNLTGLPPRWKRSLRLSTTLTRTLPPRAFYALSLSPYEVQHRMGQEDKNRVDPSQAYQYELLWYYFIVGGRRLWWQDAHETTIALKSHLVAQIGRVNELESGFEFNYFQLDNELVKYVPQKSYWGRPLLDRPVYNFSSSYHYEPYQGAHYLQDKVDNDTFVAKMGLGYDFPNPRGQRPVVEWLPVTAGDYEQQVKRWVPASVKSQLSSRVGVSFLISPHDFFVVNCGYFFQVPLFDYVLSGLKYDIQKGVKALHGNPDLKPERTVA